MTERQTKNVLRSNWTTTILSWAAALVVLATTFYFNTNNNVSGLQTVTGKQQVEIEKLKIELATKATAEYVEKMRVEREGQIQTLLDQKVDKDYLLLVDKKIELIITMLRDNSVTLNTHINKEK